MSVTRLAAAFAASAELAMISNVTLAAEGKDAAATVWSTYGHDYANTRHTDLKQINAKNIASLVPLWQYQTGQVESFEVSPIVVGDTMYVTTGVNDTVIALDARTGAAKWKFKPNLGFTTFCCGANNRGVAVDDGKVFVATLDGLLYALDEGAMWDLLVVSETATAPVVAFKTEH